MITKWNFQTPTEEELHKRDKLASELELSPVVCLLLVQRGLSTVCPPENANMNTIGPRRII